MSSHDGEDLPGLGYALQLMRTPALDPERRSSNARRFGMPDMVDYFRAEP